MTEVSFLVNYSFKTSSISLPHNDFFVHARMNHYSLILKKCCIEIDLRICSLWKEKSKLLKIIHTCICAGPNHVKSSHLFAVSYIPREVHMAMVFLNCRSTTEQTLFKRPIIWLHACLSEWTFQWAWSERKKGDWETHWLKLVTRVSKYLEGGLWR